METIGQKLKAAREKSGLSPSDVAKAIRAKTEYVTAIERDEFHKLIAPIYARGFVKLYAQHLQLDPIQFLRQFDALETAAAPVKQEVPRRREPVEGKKRAPLKIRFTAFTEVWKRIKSVELGRLRPPEMPALELPDKKWILLVIAAIVCLTGLTVLLKHAGPSTPRIRAPNAARWLADPPEPYLEIPSQKSQK